MTGNEVGGVPAVTGPAGGAKSHASGKGKAGDDLALGNDDSIKTPDVPGSATSKTAALEYREREEALKKRTGGYFTIFKKGQGYWTRMGTAIGAAVLGLMLSYTIYDKIPPYFIGNPQLGRKIAVGSALGFLVVYAIIGWTVTNKPVNVDFLIATDSEMKKVNWTSRKELIGSTKVVIVFMLIISLFLFFVDFIFATFMRLIHVLKVTPWGN